MSEVFDDALANANHRWSKTYGMDLIETEVELRFAGNKTFLRNTESGTLGDICAQYLTGPMADYYGQSKAASTKHASSTAARMQQSLDLELFIDKLAFMERFELVRGCGEDEGTGLASTVTRTSRKRSGTHSVLASTASRQKRPSLGTDQLESTFVPTHTSKNKPSTTKILVEKASCTQSEANSQVTVAWPDAPSFMNGVLTHSLFAAGRTKRVYELRFEDDPQLYVAKRFFRGGQNNSVTAEENSDFLEHELIRLQVFGWLVKQFLKQAGSDGANVEHYSAITVSDGFLVREVGEPSAPSGLASNNAYGAVWLVEPKRTRSVRKFCGTMVHPERSDKVGMTISALCHWIYTTTRKTEVFADIQGSYMAVDGQDTLILFDPMSHTVDGDSGVGDHGEKGIQKFLEDHQCNYICQGLSLEPITEGAGLDSGSDN
ncbi:hypothetical protein H1R20_g15222, partial [Candolleomyces eurysporus]